MHICTAAGALYGSTMAGGNSRATWQQLYEMSDRLLGGAEAVPWMPKKRHGMAYIREKQLKHIEAFLFLFIFHGRMMKNGRMADQEM